MKCSLCGHLDTKVIDSRLVSDASQIRRRRECIECGERVTTIETLVYNLPRVVKHSGERVVFSEDKLRKGILLALEKRPIVGDKVEALITGLINNLCRLGEREVTTAKIGELVMNELKALDAVAYVRFASVYRSFQDVEDFKKTIDTLRVTDTHQQ